MKSELFNTMVQTADYPDELLRNYSEWELLCIQRNCYYIIKRINEFLDA